MDNFIDVILFIIIFYLLYLNAKCNKKAKINLVDKIVINDDKNKQQYIINQVNKMKLKSQKQKFIHLIQAGSEHPENSYSVENFNIISRPLSSLDNTYEQYPLLTEAIDIKNNRIKSVVSEYVSAPIAAPIAVPISELVSAPVYVSNTIEGVSHAPMFAPIESVNKQVDIFLFNQINQSVNNSFAYIDSIIPSRKNKLNFNKKNISLVPNELIVDNIIGMNDIPGKCHSKYI